MIEVRIKPEDLSIHGFGIIEPTLAKHKTKCSYRHKCYNCGDWVREAWSGKERKKLCNRRLKANNKG